MGDQNPSLKSKPAQIGRSVQSLARDCVLLADLQFQLLIVDLHQFWDAVKTRLVLAIAMAILALGSVSVLLIGLARLLETATSWPAGVSELLVGGLATAIALGFLMSLTKVLADAARPLQRSQQELKDNLNWLRETLRHNDD